MEILILGFVLVVKCGRWLRRKKLADENDEPPPGYELPVEGVEQQCRPLFVY